MNKFKSLMILALVFFGSSRAEFDASSCAMGVGISAAVGCCTYGLYSYLLSKPSYAQEVNGLREMTQQLALSHADGFHVLNTPNTDYKIKTLSALFMHSGNSSKEVVQKIENELSALQKKVSTVHEMAMNADLQDSKRDELLKSIEDAQPVIIGMQNLYSLVKDVHPFIDLNKEDFKRDERFNGYEVMLHAHSEFPGIKTAEKIAQDRTMLSKIVHDAQVICNQGACTPFQYKLISNAQEQIFGSEQKLHQIVNTSAFQLERQRYELIKAEEEKQRASALKYQSKIVKAEKDNNEALARQKEYEKRLMEEKNKESQLRESAHRLHIKELKIQNGSYFREKMKKLEDQISDHKFTIRNLERELNKIQESFVQLHSHSNYKDKENNKLAQERDQLLNIIHAHQNRVEQLRQEIGTLNTLLYHRLPMSPEDENFGPYLEQLRMFYQRMVHNLQ